MKDRKEEEKPVVTEAPMKVYRLDPSDGIWRDSKGGRYTLADNGRLELEPLKGGGE